MFRSIYRVPHSKNSVRVVETTKEKRERKIAKLIFNQNHLSPDSDQIERVCPPGRKSRAFFNFSRFDRWNFSPLGPKWCSSAQPYRWICPSNAPPKEQCIPVSNYANVSFRVTAYHVHLHFWNKGIEAEWIIVTLSSTSGPPLIA